MAKRVKMKTHKGLKKRIKVTATGKVKYKRPNTSHLMSGKSGTAVRRLRKRRVLANQPIARNMVLALGEG